jgi:hypothetical protein
MIDFHDTWYEHHATTTTQHLNILISVITNNNMAFMCICEMEAILVSLNAGSWNFVCY